MMFSENDSEDFFNECRPSPEAFRHLVESEPHSDQQSDPLGLSNYHSDPIDHPSNSENNLKGGQSVETFVEKPVKGKKKTRKQPPNYGKNILGNVVNATVRAFTGSFYKRIVKLLCKKHDCNYEAVIDYYKPDEKIVYGIDRLKQMLTVFNESQRNLKELFKKFLCWYLRSGGYMNYLLAQGRMAQKKTYIREKNKILKLIEAFEDFESSIQRTL